MIKEKQSMFLIKSLDHLEIQKKPERGYWLKKDTCYFKEIWLI